MNLSDFRNEKVLQNTRTVFSLIQGRKKIIYINENLILTTSELYAEATHLISVYALDASKPKNERATFHEDLPTNEKMLILGELNAWIGNHPIPGVTVQRGCIGP